MLHKIDDTVVSINKNVLKRKYYMPYQYSPIVSNATEHVKKSNNKKMYERTVSGTWY